MKRRTKFFIAISVVLAVALISGISIYAANNYGSSSDPLVTLSYLSNKFKTEIMNSVDSAIGSASSDLSSDIDSRLSKAEKEIDDATGTAIIHDTTDVFTLVSMTSGQKLVCNAGTEIVLRGGSATGYGSGTQLTDTTSGDEVSNGASLSINHLYLVTTDGNGLAASEVMQLLVRGEYTVS